MHIAEGFLPAAHAVAWSAASAPFVVVGFRDLARRVARRPEDRVVVASAGAFSFVLSALKIPSVTGSSSHPTGVGLGTILMGPSPMAAIGTIVLLFQALLLAHGGLTTLGANVFSMAVVGPWVTWGVYRGLRLARLSLPVAGGIGVAVGVLATYATTAVQLALAHPDAETGFGGALVTFLGIFAVTQIPLSVVEGILTGFVLVWLATRSSIDVEAMTRSERIRPLRAGSLVATVLAVALLVVSPLVAQRGAEFAGADSLATEEVEEAGYEPWFDSVWSPPSGEVESFLFALQAAVGAGIIGYVLGSRRRVEPDPTPQPAPEPREPVSG